MFIIKYVMIFLVFAICFIIGNLVSRKYILRLNELKDLKNAINIMENKIKFTYETLPEIFIQTAKMFSNNIGKILEESSNYMKSMNAELAWNKSLELVENNLNKDDIESAKSLGKMLGKTDKEGQISQLELTRTFIEIQIEKARIDEEKNSKLCKTLGTIIGLAFVIILI